MADAKSNAEARAQLRACVMRFAPGATETDADDVLRIVRDGWGFNDLPQLAAVVGALEMPGLGPGAVIFWLHATVKVGRIRNGCELLLAAAVRAAERCGVSAELLDRLRDYALPTAGDGGETRH